MDWWADHFWVQLHSPPGLDKYKVIDKQGRVTYVIPPTDQREMLPGARHNRHGDYFGLNRGIEGEYSAKNGMFPKYSGWSYDIWSYTYTLSDKPDVRAKMLDHLSRMTDAAHQVAWATQMLQAGYQAEEAARRIKEATLPTDRNHALVQALHDKLMGFAKYTYERIVKPRTAMVLIVANQGKDGSDRKSVV